jgi:hypothetical protein
MRVRSKSVNTKHQLLLHLRLLVNQRRWRRKRIVTVPCGEEEAKENIGSELTFEN